jgi:DNA (cytosine-5)-methyltransferase 1
VAIRWVKCVDKRTTSKHENGNGKLAGGARLLDICCGLGGLSLAGSQLGIRVVAGVDVNSAALKTYSRNFPTAVSIFGSVRSTGVLERSRRALEGSKQDRDALRIIVSGPPCQGFSAAGSRDPKDRRNKVLVAVSHAVAQLQPDCAVIENVSTVLEEKHRGRLKRFERVLKDGGYHVEKLLLEASSFGVAQRRKRAFFLVTRNKLDKVSVHARLLRHQVAPLTVTEALHGLPVATQRPEEYDDEADYGLVANHLTMRHSARVMDKIAGIEPGKGPMSYRKLHPTRLSNTLFSGHRAPPAHFAEPRSITVREAARLQGFPDNFRVFGSFANQMEQVTNAVPPPLARAVLAVLCDLVLEERS